MAESEDGAALLMGQAKWDEEADASRLAADLQRKAERLSWPGARTLIVLLEVHAETPRGRAAANDSTPMA